MPPSYIVTIVAFVVAAILAVVVWSIVFIEYRKIVRQRKINKLLDRIIERAEDSGNESEGDQEELSALVEVGHHVEMGHHAPWDVNDL
uniref:Protein Vpu n=1 Tax=Human immunodeficiency virus type 1 TaxID=11676 RepID=D6P1M2_HV1|nr:vpu protein [Human immunodeficiency virus 1]